jgi:peptidoglycan/LPS O-acetylase OafA/YrhL
MVPEGRPASWRPDIDGLRAVAVLLVIVYHFNHAWLPGGYVGVDIFFVISGFVVTRSILHAPQASVWQGLVRFWRRRFLRIFPILIVFILATLAAMMAFAPPYPEVGYNGNIRTGVSAIFGLSNLYLYKLGANYFQDNGNNPFLHTWSLAVEEQFYIVYAIAFIGIQAIIRDARLLAKVRLIGLALTAILSLGLYALTATSHPVQTYYFLPMRFWELAAGGLLALRPTAVLKPHWAKLIQSLAAVALIGTALAPSIGAFPIYHIPLAVAAAAALIAVGNQNQTLMSKALEARPVIYVGLISYSLYLWHWPILVLFGNTVGLESFPKAVVAFGLMGLLAALSYRWVESPLRRKTTASSSLAYVAPIALAMVVMTGIAIQWPGRLYLGSHQAWAADWIKPNGQGYVGEGRITHTGCTLTDGAVVPTTVPEACTSKPLPSHPGKLLVIGDSQGSADWAMAAYGQALGAYDLATLVHNGCSINIAPQRQAASCARYWDQAPALIRTSTAPGDVVLLAPLWEQIVEAPAKARLEALSLAAKASGARLIVQARLPHFAKATYVCTREWFRLDYAGCVRDRSAFEAERIPVMAALRDLSANGSNFVLWDPAPILCGPTQCAQFDDKGPLFRDYTHLADYGSRKLGPGFLQTVTAARRP